MKYYILFGPPGAGKGTHGAAIAQKYNFKHLSTGELLRAEIKAGTELGKEAKSLIDKGMLVPDSVVEGMIESAFATIKGYNGFLLDGFPRTVSQAHDLDAMLAKRNEAVTGVVGIIIPDETVIKRIKGRAEVEGRADDANEDIIRNRIKTYHTQTEPIIDFYKEQGKYFECNGDNGPIEVNRAKVLALVESIEAL